MRCKRAQKLDSLKERMMPVLPDPSRKSIKPPAHVLSCRCSSTHTLRRDFPIGCGHIRTGYEFMVVNMSNAESHPDRVLSDAGWV